MERRMASDQWLSSVAEYNGDKDPGSCSDQRNPIASGSDGQRRLRVKEEHLFRLWLEPDTAPRRGEEVRRGGRDDAGHSRAGVDDVQGAHRFDDVDRRKRAK